MLWTGARNRNRRESARNGTEGNNTVCMFTTERIVVHATPLISLTSFTDRSALVTLALYEFRLTGRRNLEMAQTLTFFALHGKQPALDFLWGRSLL